MEKFEKIMRLISRYLSIAGGLALLFMMIMVILNTIIRPLYKPILGTPEMVGYALVVVVSLGLSHTGLSGSNVKVGMLVHLLSHRTGRIFDCVTTILSIFVVGVIAWQSASYGWQQQAIGEHSSILLFPLYPFRYIVSIGFALLLLSLFLNLYKIIRGVE